MYNRSLNAVVLGYVLNFSLLAISGALVAAGQKVGALAGMMAIISFAAAYVHEHCCVALDRYSIDSEEYALVYPYYKVSAVIVPLATFIGYVAANVTIIFGV